MFPVFPHKQPLSTHFPETRSLGSGTLNGNRFAVGSGSARCAASQLAAGGLAARAVRGFAQAPFRAPGAEAFPAGNTGTGEWRQPAQPWVFGHEGHLLFLRCLVESEEKSVMLQRYCDHDLSSVCSLAFY